MEAAAPVSQRSWSSRRFVSFIYIYIFYYFYISVQATPNVLNKAATVGKAPAGGGATAAPGVTDADMKKFTVSSSEL